MPDCEHDCTGSRRRRIGAPEFVGSWRAAGWSSLETENDAQTSSNLRLNLQGSSEAPRIELHTREGTTSPSARAMIVRTAGIGGAENAACLAYPRSREPCIHEGEVPNAVGIRRRDLRPVCDRQHEFPRSRLSRTPRRAAYAIWHRPWESN